MVTIKPIKNNPIITTMDKLFKNRKPFYCQKLNDSFYRGSEPSSIEFKKLANKGVKTILNLKTVSAKELDNLSKEAAKNGLDYINIPINPFKLNKSLPFIMDTINSASKENPLFIHCTYGKDRTGFVSALVNYFKNNLPMNEAIKDMNDHGFRNTIFFNMKKCLKNIDKQIGNFTTGTMH